MAQKIKYMTKIHSEVVEPGEPKGIVLPQFLSFDNPQDPDYMRLRAGINYLEGGSREVWQESIARMLETPALKDYLSSKLKGEILVDCGGGREEFMLRIAAGWQVGTYINIDGRLSEYDKSAHWQEYNEPMPGKEPAMRFVMGFRDPKTEQSTQVQGISGEMLRVIARFPNHSANFVVNGIDYDSNTEKDSHWRALVAEITRATRKGGVVFGYGTPFFEYLDPKEFRNTKLAIGSMQGIFEKV